MNERMKVLWFGVVLGVALFVYVYFIRKSRRRAFFAKVKENGWFVVATLQESKFIRGQYDPDDKSMTRDINVGTYLYEQNGQWKERKVSMYTGLPPTITFYFDPKKPDKLYREAALSGKPGGFLGLMPFFVPIFVIMLYQLFTKLFD